MSESRTEINSVSPSRGADEELKALLETFQMRSLEAAARIMGRDEVYNEAKMQVDAARQTILAFVSRIREERDRAREEIEKREKR